MWHGKSEAVYDKGIAVPRTKFLWFHTTQYYSNVIEKKKRNRKVIYFVKEGHKALGLFVERYAEKHEAFKYPLTIFPLAISTTEEKLYQPKTKYHSRNCFIELSNAKFIEVNTSLVVVFDPVPIVQSFASLKTLESLFQTLVKAFRLQATILVFNNYTEIFLKTTRKNKSSH